MGRPALDALDWVDGWSHRRARPLSQRLALQTRVTHRGCESRLACAMLACALQHRGRAQGTHVVAHASELTWVSRCSRALIIA